MDLDGDGHIDVLCGSYSRRGHGKENMAGTFQWLRGTGGNNTSRFTTAEVLLGNDGEPLLLPIADFERAAISPTCDRTTTSPFIADLDNDGHLDLISGNATGTFAWFRGTGKGNFDPEATWLSDKKGAIRVDRKSDPVLVDWDGDGDLDLLSGCEKGGVFLFRNRGKPNKPKWAKRKTLLKPKGLLDPLAHRRVGEQDLEGPQTSTRICVADIDGNGKLDLLIGDHADIQYPAAGVTVKHAKKRLKKLRSAEAKAIGNPSAMEQVAVDKARAVTQQRTGFVWVMLRK